MRGNVHSTRLKKFCCGGRMRSQTAAWQCKYYLASRLENKAAQIELEGINAAKAAKAGLGRVLAEVQRVRSMQDIWKEFVLQETLDDNQSEGLAVSSEGGGKQSEEDPCVEKFDSN